MNRRSFLGGLGALIGGVMLEKAIPFGRVWSFPKEIVIAKPTYVGQVIGMMHEYIRPNLPLLYGRDDRLLAQMNVDIDAAWRNVGITVPLVYARS